MLIGINGNKGAGKDTVGQYLVDFYGFEKLSFADKLKKSVIALFPATTLEEWENWKNDDDIRIVIENKRRPTHHLDDISARAFLQFYGTESHRNIFGDDFWVEALFKNYDPWDGKDYVITDARFNNELKAVKERGGLNVRIVRQQTTRVIDPHASEAMPAMAYLDYHIYNEGTIADLYNQVDAFMALVEENEVRLQKTS